MDASQRLRDLILITGRLAEVLERENAALKTRRREEMKDILDEKVNIGRVYENRIQALADAGDDMSKVDAEIKARLTVLAGKVKRLMQENGTLLRIAIEANRRVVGIIADAVKKSAPDPGTYSKKGAMSRQDGRSTTKNVALTLDRTL